MLQRVVSPQVKFVMALVFSVIAALVVVSTPAVADDSKGWLARMGEAFATQSYNGVFVYTHGSSMDTLRIIHPCEQASMSQNRGVMPYAQLVEDQEVQGY